MKLNFSGLHVALLLGSFTSAEASTGNLRGLKQHPHYNRALAVAAYDTDYSEFVHLDFNEFSAGDILTDQVDGVTFSSSPVNKLAMIFDSAAAKASGGDSDLLDTENIGLKNMIIYSEDGDQTDPDDSARGGTITVEFKEEVVIESMGLKDNEEGVTVDLGGETIKAPIVENGEFSLVWLRLIKTNKMVIECRGSCGIPFINYLKKTDCPEPPTNPPTPPPTCDIDLDQRVRIQPKPSEGTCICCDDKNFGKLGDNGKLRFVYNAGNTVISSQDDGKVKVSGSTPICGDGERVIVSKEQDPFKAEGDGLFFDGTLKCGDNFEAIGKFKGSTYIHVISGSTTQTTEFHTSCSQPINIGDVYASVEVIGFTDENGNGADNTPLDLGPGLSDPTSLSVDVKPGDTIVYTYIVDIVEGPVTDVVLSAYDSINNDYTPKLVTETEEKLVYVYSFTVPQIEQYPFVVEAGSSVEAVTEYGDNTCQATAQLQYTVDKPPFVGDVCETCGKPRALSFIYNPGNVDLTSPDSKAQLEGSLPSGGPKRVVVSNKEDIDHIFFEGTLEPGDVFRAAVPPGADKFDSNTYILVFEGSTKIQTMTYHTSCSGTIKLGDILGSIQVVKYEGENCVIE